MSALDLQVDDIRLSLRMITNFGVFVSYMGKGNKWLYYDNKAKQYTEYDEIKRDAYGVLVVRSKDDQPNNAPPKYLRLNTMCGEGATEDTIQTKSLFCEWDSVWRFNDEKKYLYRKNEDRWVKYISTSKADYDVQEFDEILNTDEGVVLQSVDDKQLFLRLTNGELYMGKKKDAVDDSIGHGKWINKRRQKGPFLGDKDY